MKSDLREFFSFSKKERTGIFLLLFVCALVWVIPKYFSRKKIKAAWIEVTPIEFDTIKRQLSIQITRDEQKFRENYRQSKLDDAVALFPFDPNTISRDGLIRLGLLERTASSWINYRSKGGLFKDPEDLKKIYGLSAELAERIIPYARFHRNSNQDTIYRNKKQESFSFSSMDINKADSSALMLLPGIGIRLSSRIVRYRERLGGFYNLEQLNEVYGINDSIVDRVKQMLYLDVGAVKKMDLNQIGFNELSRHPYIGFSRARLILAYRKSHGKIGDRQDLVRACLLDSAEVEKILPYVVL